ncbi:MAG TPA: phosphatase PAP2 family protein [Planctomycetota bacterium]|nr:phosphatase PAP2 family protein [Planctomycetota bacterium]
MRRRLDDLIDRVGQRLGGYDLMVLVCLQALALALWLFIELADEVVEGQTHGLDERIIMAMRVPGDPSDPIGPPWLEEIGRDCTALGGIAMLALVVAAVCGFLAIRGAWHAVVLCLGATIGGLGLSLLVKEAFSRPRPALVPHLSVIMTSSFPSGHSLMSAVVYLTLGALLARLAPGRRLKVYCIAVATLMTGMVGVSRVYLGVHWPTDVVAGWALGLVWAIVCWLVAKRLQRKGTVEAEA